MAGPRRRNHAALHGRHRLDPLSQDADAQAEQPKKESAESRKRRPRHEIWDLEDRIEEFQAHISALEQDNKALHRKLEFMQTTVRVREAQVERLKQFGTSESANNSRLLQRAPADSSAQHPWAGMFALPADAQGTSSSSNSGVGSAASPAARAQPQFSLPAMSPSGLEVPTALDIMSPFHHFSIPAHALHMDANLVPSRAASPADSLGVDMLRLISMLSAEGEGDAAEREKEVEKELALWSDTQIIETYKQTSNHLSQLLFAAEEGTSPSAMTAMAHLTQIVATIRRMGAIAKVCNPGMVRVVGRPVCEGMELPTDEHWDGVAAALMLTPQQMEDVAILNDLRLKWMHKIQQEHVIVSRSLSEVLKEAELQWRSTWDEGQVRKAEMMNKVHRVIGAERWVLVLVDELLTDKILDTVQVARCLVHSYPYVPDSCAIVDAVSRLHAKRKQAAADKANNNPAGLTSAWRLPGTSQPVAGLSR